MGIIQSTTSDQSMSAPSLFSLLQAHVVNWDIVRECLEAQPEQACLFAHGVEPSLLQLAIMRSAPVEIVELLVECYDDAIGLVDQDGQTVLHTAVADAGLVRLFLRKRPGLARSRDTLGRLPLHLSTNVVSTELLIESFPQGVEIRSQDSSSLPIHYALQRDVVDTQLIRALVHSLPPSSARRLLTRNKKGQTPIGLLIKRVEREFSEDLWHVVMEMAKCIEPRGLELHTLIRLGFCSSSLLMDRALQDFPRQAHQRDNTGKTPLHVAAASGSCTRASLERLIDENPKAPRMTDNEGRLPIDWAAESPNTHLHCLSLLMKGEPRAIDTRDLRDGHYPFVSAALGEQESVNSTYYLLRAKPHVLSYFHMP